MTTPAVQSGVEYLSRGTDHLGSLQRTLRDLIGYRTLANELIQNADDAGINDEVQRASEIAFDVRPDVLIVDNDGRFSDCGSVNQPICAWKQQRGRRCDFHRFRTVAGGDKRNEMHSTGAFGIGFTAVYQVTDRPELISAGRHWIIDELAEESRRIVVCSGCAKCSDLALPNTRFILPFATDPTSALRAELKVAPFGDTNRQELISELEVLLPDSLLFLKSINKLVLQVEGKEKLSLQRLKEGDTLLICPAAAPDRVWYHVHGNFDEEAQRLRAKHQEIESKRTSHIGIAFSDEVDALGLLYACLPTQQVTGLPFHINADFFPSSNRKEIVLESDYQSEWNRAALRAAAALATRTFTDVARQLSPSALWKFIESVHAVRRHAEAKKLDSSFALFWDALLPVLQSAPIVLTTQRSQVAPPAACIEYSRRHREFVPLFEAVGISTPHEEIWSHVAEGQLRSALGVPVLTAARVHKAFEQVGLTTAIEITRAPALLRHADGLDLAWSCVEAFLRDRTGAQDRKYLSSLSLVPCDDSVLRAPSDVRRADAATVDLFRSIDESAHFYIESSTAPTALLELTAPFSVRDALGILERTSAIEYDGNSSSDLAVALLRWFANRNSELDSADIRRRIAALPIFPSISGLYPLKALALPGDFKDELELASLLDIPRLSGLRDFLLTLGAEELTFTRYVRNYLPRAFTEAADSESADRKLRAIELLAERFGAIEDEATRAALQRVPLIKCSDGIFRPPAEVYFASQLNIAILGPQIHRADWSPNSPLKESVARLYQWLGVSGAPRDEDLIDRVRSLDPALASDREVIPIVLQYLDKRTKGRAERLEGSLSVLRSIAWLPARGDQTRCYRPDDLYLEYRAYLFSSQATFIDLSATVQREFSSLLQALGVRSEPEVPMVIRHLLRCAQEGSEVKEEIYRFLNDNATDSRLRMLQNKACIAIPGHGFVRPDQVYWSDHPFGRYRHRLSPGLRKYSDLFQVLGVREQPGPNDACRVLLEIWQAKGQPHLALEDDLDIVMSCWHLLSLAYVNGEGIEAELNQLRHKEVIPDARGLLCRPSWLYFDDRVGLKNRFGRYLEYNLIPRPSEANVAMTLAGVRSIKDVVEAQLTHEPVVITGPDLLAHIRDRNDQIERILTFHKLEPSTAKVRIGGVQFKCVNEIRIRYLAHVFGRSEPVPSEEERAMAHFDGHTVFYFVGDGELAWREIAKELAVLVSPGGEPGPLAASLKEVLASANRAEAERFLDDLGFPPAAVGLTAVPTDSVVEQIGAPAGESPSGSGQNSPTGTGTPIQEAGEGTPGTPCAGRSLHQPGVSHGSSGGRSSVVPSQNQSRFPVYVDTGDRKSEPMDDQSRERLKEVDRKGVERVSEAEVQAGRHPTVMPHNNKGFDIESRNEDGEIERLIEVKSTTTVWRERGVALSRDQFNLAEDSGIKYWLYVVEKALDDDFRIYRIQNPAKRANEFVYDGGWKQLAGD